MFNVSSLYGRLFSAGGILFFSKFLMLLTALLFARSFGPEVYGEYSYILSLCGILSIPIVAGMHPLLVREISKGIAQLDNGYVYRVTIWSLKYTLSMSAVVLLCLFVVNNQVFIAFTTSIFFLLAGIIVFRGLLNRHNAILYGLNYPIIAMLPQTILVPLICIICLAASYLLDIKFTLEFGLLITVFATILANVVSYFFMKNKTGLTFNKLTPRKYKSKRVSSLYKALIPLSLIGVVTILNAELGTFLLGVLSDSESTAYFKIALNSVLFLTIGTQIVNSIIAPDLVKLYKKSELNAMQKIITKSANFNFLITTPLFVIMIIFGSEFIILLFGKDFESAYLPLCILAVGQFVNVIFGSVGMILNMTGHEKYTFKSFFMALAVTSILYVFLIPSYGEVGAATALSLGMVLWGAFMSRDIYILIKLKTWPRFKNID